jgi:hypothetical protein
MFFLVLMAHSNYATAKKGKTGDKEPEKRSLTREI